MLTKDIKNKLETVNGIIGKYIPEELSIVGVNAMVASCALSALSSEMQVLRTLAKHNICFKVKYLQKTRSNNWLKIHGYPMKRKIHH